VAAVIAAGIIPAGLEMMDKPMTAAVEDFVHAGYDLDAAAILLCESDGTPEEVEEEIDRMLRGAARLRRHAHGGQQATRPAPAFWSGRKNAFPASGRISPDYMCMDSTIPRKRWPTSCWPSPAMERSTQLRCCNVFHAGDGNLHPLILFDANDPDQLHRCELFGADILETSVRWAARSPANTAWASRSSTRCACSSARRARADVCRQARLRPRRSAQPRQGHPHAAPLRRIRPHAREEGAAAVPRTGALLMDAHCCAWSTRCSRRASPRPLDIRGGGTKAFYGEVPQGEPLDVRAGRHQQLRTQRTGGHRARRHAAGRAGSGAGRTGPVPALRAAALRRRGSGTVGGMVAAGLAGPARASAGSVRDYVLGATLLNGRGELLHFGGQVMKNVAGYDVSRLLAGSMGMLGVICEVSLKVLPRRCHATCRIRTDQASAIAAQRMGRPAAAAERQRLVGRHAGAAPGGRRRGREIGRTSHAGRRADRARRGRSPSGPGCATTRTSSSSARQGRAGRCHACGG
jgi:FAD/FMN-containing dehydrogenase